MARVEILSAQEQLQKQTPDEVLAYYCRIYGEVPEYINSMVRLYEWHRGFLTPNDLESLDWYFSEGEYIDILTNEGRQVKDVARVFIDEGEHVDDWVGGRKVKSILQTLDRSGLLSPLIVVPGKRYPGNPDSSFIDIGGVYQSLAICIHHLKNPKNNLKFDALIGSKPSLAHRILNKFTP